MKSRIQIVGLVMLLVPVAAAQEVVISGFPLGVGTTVTRDFFEPYRPQLQAMADELAAEQGARLIIVGQADGARYTEHNDAKNPGLSLGRAHVLRNVFVDDFGVEPVRIFIQSNDVHVKGEAYRSVSVRIEKPPATPPRVVAPVVMGTPVETEPVEIVENTNYFNDRMTLRLGAGVSSSPFGGLPMISGAVIWNKKVALEANLGHTFWSDSYAFEGASLETWRRMVGFKFSAYPWHDKPLSVVAGWVRVEEIAQSYYEYVKLSEGPVLGVSVFPFNHFTISALYNPARQRLADLEVSDGKNGQFLLSIGFYTDFGGGQ